MAQQFLSLNRGQNLQNVLTATSAPTADIYLQILSTHSPTREDVILAMRLFEQYIIGNGLPTGETGVNLPVL